MRDSHDIEGSLENGSNIICSHHVLLEDHPKITQEHKSEMVRVVFGVFVLTACRSTLFACRAVLLASRVHISRVRPGWLSPRIAC